MNRGIIRVSNVLLVDHRQEIDDAFDSLGIVIVSQWLDSPAQVWKLVCECDKFRTVSKGEMLYRYIVIVHTYNGKNTYSLEECES